MPTTDSTHYDNLYSGAVKFALDAAERWKTKELAQINGAERFLLNQAWPRALTMVPDITTSALDSAVDYLKGLSGKDLLDAVDQLIRGRVKAQAIEETE